MSGNVNFIQRVPLPVWALLTTNPSKQPIPVLKTLVKMPEKG